MGERFDTRDRISELPEPILHHILSFLFLKDAVQTIVLSKMWNHVWNTLPCLNLGANHVCEPKERERRNFFPRAEESDLEIRRKREERFTFVDQTLMNRRMQSTSIQKFWVDMRGYDFELASYVDRWIDCLVECNIKELILHAAAYCDRWYTLPQSVFAAKSLTAINLSGCNLVFPCGDIKFSSLQKLHLHDVYVDDQLIQNLISICAGIEDLQFIYCIGFKRLQISGLLNLKKFKVQLCDFEYEKVTYERKKIEYDKVEIEALNLRSFIYNGQCIPCKFNIAACARLKVLSLCGANITDKWVHELLPKLPFLESLSLVQCGMLEAIEISSYCLKRLMLSSCKKLVEANIDTPNLVYFNYRGDILSFSLNALAILEVNLELYPKVTNDMGYAKLTEFLRRFNHSKVVKLRSEFSENVIIPKEMREKLVPPLPSVYHLVLCGEFLSLTSQEAVELVDSLQWISPHLENLAIVLPNLDEDTP